MQPGHLLSTVLGIVDAQVSLVEMARCVAWRRSHHELHSVDLLAET
jgi:hypothetical protein